MWTRRLNSNSFTYEEAIVSISDVIYTFFFKYVHGYFSPGKMIMLIILNLS